MQINVYNYVHMQMSSYMYISVYMYKCIQVYIYVCVYVNSKTSLTDRPLPYIDRFISVQKYHPFRYSNSLNRPPPETDHVNRYNGRST